MSRYRAMFALLTICVLLGATTNLRGRSHLPSAAGKRVLLPLIMKPPPAYKLNAQEATLFAAINAQRVLAGCPPLALSISLAKAARGHSRDMAQRNYFSHTGSDGSRPATRAALAGYDFNGGFEVISAGQDTAAGALAAWLGSRGHRDILLNCSLDDGGPGFVRDTDGNGYQFYWTVMLGAR